MFDQFSPGEESVAQTASPNIQTAQAHYDPNAAVSSLLQALGTGSSQQAAAAINQEYQARRLQDQQQKIDFYTQQVRQATEPGSAVSQAQAQKIVPEMVPIIAAHVSESIGKQNAMQQWQQITANVDNDASLRFDSGARLAYLNDQRAKFAAAIPPGNDFYASGAMAAVDSAIQQNQGRWLSETAQYHNQVQVQQVKNDTVDALVSQDPQAAFSSMSEKNKVASSLTTQQVNAAAVDATIKFALQSSDPSHLDKIPDRFLNVDSKEQLYSARLQIMNNQRAYVTMSLELQRQQRDEADRKARIEINQRIASGQVINPADYAEVGNGHMMEYASSMLAQPTLPDAVSKARAAQWEQQLFNKGMFGNVGSEDDIRDSALAMPGVNPADRAAMVSKAHAIYQGAVLMDDPRVVSEMKPITALVDQVTSSPASKISALDGVNLRTNVLNMWRGRVRSGFQNYMDDNNGQAPGGAALDQILQTANGAATKYVQEATKISNIGKPVPDAISSPVTPKNATALPPGVTLVSGPGPQAPTASPSPAAAPVAAPKPAPVPTPPAAPASPVAAPPAAPSAASKAPAFAVDPHPQFTTELAAKQAEQHAFDLKQANERAAKAKAEHDAAVAAQAAAAKASADAQARLDDQHKAAQEYIAQQRKAHGG